MDVTDGCFPVRNRTNKMADLPSDVQEDSSRVLPQSDIFTHQKDHADERYDSTYGTLESGVGSIPENSQDLCKRLQGLTVCNSVESVKSNRTFSSVGQTDPGYGSFNSCDHRTDSGFNVSCDEDLRISSISEEEIRENVLEQYRQKQRSLFVQDEEGYTELHIVLIHLLPNHAVELINRAPDPECLNTQNYLRQTALHLAVITKLALVVRRLIVAGASAELQDRCGNSALHLACKEGNVQCAHALMTPVNSYYESSPSQLYMAPHQPLPQNLEVTNFEGKTCLHLAAESFLGYHGNDTHLEVIALLLSSGADINAMDCKSGRTILHYAAESGNIQLVKMTLQYHKVEVNAMTYDGKTAVMLAGGRGHKPVVMRLLESGADIHIGRAELSDSVSSDEDMTDESEVEYDDICIGGQYVR